ncbi:hypothetical protein AVEN_114954-1 [Araneus ventricosus]|uniref:Uncharacterized protein n=1 Tax=Araneus ventricosus TaxID=182803 RepID=A0A4Y2D827_ARAVE|nr:hypothetical protein AVEN_114954-1 [Araneus ventricosus]
MMITIHLFARQTQQQPVFASYIFTTTNQPITTIVNEVLEEAKQSCLHPSFKEARKRKKERFFDEKCEDESSEISQHKKKFKLALLKVNDRIEAELETIPINAKGE